ncbi:unnamed protein product [Prorocentrum cordatum]|uniref:Uncharacterized protein n=1 Tax=Prorocentrum cordatum TaxID=2364126 RepID=A0ABN9R371_9DINO|nr:unnamed protein product [Polarella glacialis]
MPGAFMDDNNNADRNNRHTWNGVCNAMGSRAVDNRPAPSPPGAVGSPKGAPEKDPEVVPEPEEDHPKPECPDKDTCESVAVPLANETAEDTAGDVTPAAERAGQA